MRRSGSITEHFNWEDLLCRCGACDESVDEDRILDLARWAEQLQEAVGRHRLIIIDAYQCERRRQRMAEVGGEEHGRYNALDLIASTLSPRSLQVNLAPFVPDLLTGLGSFAGYTHCDRGVTERKWRR